MLKRQKRRTRVVLCIAALCVMAAGVGCDDAAHRPNIVVILADDMGYGDLACQNPESKIPTPNLDRIASEGIRFTDAHSPSAVCTPTRYSLLTGRYCWRTELKAGVLGPWDPPLTDPGRLTLPEFLKKHGYDTVCIGKWHLGWEWSRTGDAIDFSKPLRGGPLDWGFDYYFGVDLPNYPPYCFIENDRTVGIPTEEKPEDMFGRPGPMMKGWKLEEVLPKLTEKAVGYIRAKPGERPFTKTRDAPFFLYFSLTAPHTPIAPSPEFSGTSEAGAYGDFVFQVDWTVGEIMKALEKSGQAENTGVFFTSDNGSPGRDGTDMGGPLNSVRRFGHNPSFIYRGIKTDVWEGGHRVPFLARWPGHIESRTVSREIISHVDLMATCAAIVGAALPHNAGVDSYNILPALTGAKLEQPIREATVHHSIDGMFAIRQGKWKLILGRGSGGWTRGGEEEGPPVQLYDMEADASETTNLAAEYPEVVEQLANLLLEYDRSGRSVPPPE